MSFLKDNLMEIILIILLLIVAFPKIKIFFKYVLHYLLKTSKIISLKVILQAINKLSKFELYLSISADVSKDTLKLEDLTANLSDSENNDQLKIYLNSLKSAILNENVINIALTGGFGSGKSTIINEFIKVNRGFEYLSISLANFNDKNNDEKIIETSILQQILYFEKKKRLKESSFHRIYFSRPYKKFIFSIAILVWIYSIIYLFFSHINSKIILSNHSVDYGENVFVLIFITGVFIIIYKSFNVFKNIKFSKITESSIEIVNEKMNTELSVFNRNIEEIIYFFEKTNTNVVIIEDIDRFSDDIAIKLFSKIRELSLLLKQAKDITQPVKFIFSVKDELILNQKTKFFDLIIPVIPIIDYKNSKNKFFNKLETFIDGNVLNRNFISEVSGYIYDMRTVINISNEFKIYHKILDDGKRSLDCDKLFAIILYKNLFPDDFAKIQKRKSRLHEVFFEKRSELINNINNPLQEKVDELDKKIKKLATEIDSTIVTDIIELRKIYIYEVFTSIGKKYPSYPIEKIEDIGVYLELIIEDEGFNKIVESEDIRYSNRYNSKSLSGITFKDIEENINPILSYKKREQLIKDFHQNKLLQFESEAFEFRLKIDNNNKLNLYEFYMEFPDQIDQFIEKNYSLQKKVENEDLKEIRMPNIELVKYLIKNEYINEDFIEYISYVYPGSLSTNDNQLKIKIIQDNKTNFNEKIDNVENLINEIQDNRFKYKSVLIYGVLDALFESCKPPKVRNSKLDFVLHQLYNYENNTKSFLAGYTAQLQNSGNVEILSSFYNEMSKWEGFWEFVEGNFSLDLKRKVLIDLILLFSGDEGNSVLKTLNSSKRLSFAIEQDKNLPKDLNEKINPLLLIKTFEALQVKFEEITFDEKIIEVLEGIYKKRLYKINIINFKLFSQFEKNYKFNDDSFQTSNYSFLSTNATPIFELVQLFINEYLENVYFKLDNNIDESSNRVFQLMESEYVKKDNKLKIIEKGFNGKFTQFGKINDKEIYELILQKNKIIASWESVLEYFGFEGKLNNVICEFLNHKENYELLSIDYIVLNKDKLFGEENDAHCDFIYSIINSDEILDDCFKAIFSFTEELTLDPSIITIEKRTQYLISIKLIEFNQSNYEFLIEKSLPILALLIKENETSFMENFRSYDISIELLQMLLYSELSVENIKMIIKNEEVKVLESEDEFLTKLVKFFLIQKINDYSLSVFYYILESEIAEELKVKLFILDFPTHGDEQTRTSLLKLGGKFSEILESVEVEFPNIEPYKTFLNLLKEKRIIKRTYEKKGDILKTSYHN